MAIASLHEFLEADCMLQHPNRRIFVSIYHGTNGRPCDGCVFKHNCKQRHDLELVISSKKRTPKKPMRETNAEIAKRLGITKRQAAKMRKAGKL